MKTTKKVAALLLALSMILGLVSCGSSADDKTSDSVQSEQTVAETVTETTAPEDSSVPESEASETEAAKAADGETKPVLLVVSFGTSYNDTRVLTIEAIEKALADAYPEYEVRRAFTAQTVIDILEERDGLKVDNVAEAMSRLVLDGVKEVIIQPTHVIQGAEYNDVLDDVSAYADQFDRLIIGKPILSDEEDYTALIECLAEETAQYNDENTAIVFMGHGTHHDANSSYTTLQNMIYEAGYTNYFIGTVEAAPSLDDVLELVKESGATKVVLLPLMIVAGDHANNDMAGDEEDSWKTAFTEAGYEVECVLKGLGEYKAIQELFVKHAKDAMEFPDAVSASQIEDGTYELTNIKSSSSMFNIVKCVLTVADGKMSAVITMSGTGYGKLFVGTGEEALAASEEDYIPSVIDSDGAVTFELPMEELNSVMKVAAWSIKKEKWYDRDLVFFTDGIPETAIAAE